MPSIKVSTCEGTPGNQGVIDLDHVRTKAPSLPGSDHDGSCAFGNGIVHKVVTVETLSGTKTLKMFSENGVITGARVDMDEPNLDPASLPSTVEGPGPAIGVPLTVDVMEEAYAARG